MPAERDAESWRAEGNSRFDARDWDAAALAYEEALALEPGNADTWYRLGNVRQEQQRDREAAESFERAVKLDPSHAQAWNNLGVSREALGLQAQAIDAYRRALRENAALLPALGNLSHLFMRNGDYASAVPLLESATAMAPANPDLWESLGIALAKLERSELADRALRTAAEKQKSFVKPFVDAAQAAIARGDPAEIQGTLAAALKAAPGNPALVHMLAAARGETSSRPPAGYVAALFDDFARDYDARMTGILEYRVPGLLAQAVAPVLGRIRHARIADLGCGTGLVGAALGGLGADIVGIDLSPLMLERAAKLGAYSRLVRGDVVEELEKLPPASLHAVLAADVFIYVGALEAVFEAAARALMPGGLLAFSVEGAEGEGFCLTIGGRYAHSPAYLRGLAARHGLAERSMERIRVRRERDAYLEGWLACFNAPA